MTDAATKRRWLQLTPDRLVAAMLVIEGFLLVSERFRWFAFNRHKGWTVLIALATVAVAMLLMLAWFAGGLLFRRRFQFSIRSLLALMLAVAVSLGWLTTAMQQASRQRNCASSYRPWTGTAC